MMTDFIPTLRDALHVLGWVGAALIVAVVLGLLSGLLDAALGELSWPSEQELDRRARLDRPVIHIVARKDGVR